MVVLGGGGGVSCERGTPAPRRPPTRNLFRFLGILILLVDALFGDSQLPEAGIPVQCADPPSASPVAEMYWGSDLSACACVYLSVFLSLCLSVCLSLCLSGCLPFSLSICMYICLVSLCICRSDLSNAIPEQTTCWGTWLIRKNPPS